MLFFPIRICSFTSTKGKIFEASSIKNFTSVPGFTIISISVESLRGLSRSNIKQLPPLKINGIPTLANASSNPKA